MSKFYAFLLLLVMVGVGYGQISVGREGEVKIGDLKKADHLTGSSLDIAVKEIYVCPTANSSASFTISNHTPGTGTIPGGVVVPQSIGWNQVNQATFLAPIQAGGLNLGTSGKPIGTISAQSISSYSQSYTSDVRVKKSIMQIGDEWRGLMSLRPVKFDYDYEALYMDSSLASNRVGFIAQEVKEVYPDLVRYDSMVELYTLDYVSIIPYLVKGLQAMDSIIIEQRILIDDYRRQLAEMEESLPQMDLFSLQDSEKKSELGTERFVLGGNVLLQNIPNPYSNETTISYRIERIKNQAYIGIYDMNGQEKERITGLKEGKGEILLKGIGLPAGMYLYSLVVDGCLVGTKRMVISE